MSNKNNNKLSDRRKVDNKDVNNLVKCGFMTKRSQNKKRFTPVNYKTRWFELDHHYLYYYDVEHAQVMYLSILYLS